MSTKRKLPSKLGQPMVKPSAKLITKELVNDSRAIVSGGGQADGTDINGETQAGVIVIDSDPESAEEYSSEEEEDEKATATEKAVQDTTLPSAEKLDVEMGEPEDEEATEPTFGDLVRATISEPIDVPAAFPNTENHPQNALLAPPSGASLSTVLTQALKTSDNALLESCLQTTDLPTVRLTIQRLSSPLASNLLSILATRLHRRPGRAGSLMVWIQWTLVTHGGYLATQPELVRKLSSLNKVIDERARGLQSLLTLKGKLDMLEAQGQLRRNMMQQRRARDESDDEEGVVYVEGEESDDSDMEGDVLAENGVKSKSKASSQVLADQIDDSEDDEMPMAANGVETGSTDDEESDDGGLIDDEASESENDDEDEDEVDHEDEDEMEEEDESDDAAPARSAPPTKLQKVGGLFSRRR